MHSSTPPRPARRAESGCPRFAPQRSPRRCSRARSAAVYVSRLPGCRAKLGHIFMAASTAAAPFSLGRKLMLRASCVSARTRRAAYAYTSLASGRSTVPKPAANMKWCRYACGVTTCISHSSLSSTTSSIRVMSSGRSLGLWPRARACWCTRKSSGSSGTSTSSVLAASERHASPTMWGNQSKSSMVCTLMKRSKTLMASVKVLLSKLTSSHTLSRVAATSRRMAASMKSGCAPK
mmetsp:Transcript_33977/g.95635  ORF Transcript_33977/g.95635 Transcript_33977/m.95635 type:complete len:235 (-) Transcript_33977:337-1041(-)